MPTSSKQQFLEAYDREFATTMRVLRAFPPEQIHFRPHPKLKTAGELAWVFALERRLGLHIWHDELARGVPSGSKPPAPPDSWKELLAAIETSSAEYRAVISAASEEDLEVKVHFFTAPKTMGEASRHHWLWFLLHDEIHHRGQSSIYLRAAGAKVPSIYGPTADEPWV